MENHKIKRIAIKFSGEYSAEEIKTSVTNILNKASPLILCGGGNLVRGRDAAKSNRSYEDRVGMCSTLINSIRLKAAMGTKARVFSTNLQSDVSAIYNVDEVNRCLAMEEIPIIAGGLGCGYLSTDTALVIRALEANCECAIKVTRIGGVYDKDPKLFEDAIMLYKLTYDEAERKRVFDRVSVIIAKENRLPFIVASLQALEKYICFNDESNCSIIR